MIESYYNNGSEAERSGMVLPLDREITFDDGDLPMLDGLACRIAPSLPESLTDQPLPDPHPITLEVLKNPSLKRVVIERAISRNRLYHQRIGVSATTIEIKTLEAEELMYFELPDDSAQIPDEDMLDIHRRTLAFQSFILNTKDLSHVGINPFEADESYRFIEKSTDERAALLEELSRRKQEESKEFIKNNGDQTVTSISEYL